MNPRSARAILSTAVGLVACWTMVAAPAVAAIVSADASGARAALRSAPFEETIVLSGVGDLLTGERLDLELRAFDVWAPGGKVLIHDDLGVEEMAPPRSRYFRGSIRGRSGSRALVVVHSDGDVRGLIRDGAELRVLGQSSEEARQAGGLESRRLSARELDDRRRPFSCELSALGSAGSPWRAPALPPSAGMFAAPEAPLAPAYSARYAVETDFEFYSLFNNTTVATEYITDLMGFISILYDDEINTTIALGEIKLRSAVGDPWGQTGTVCSLFEFGRYWNNNYSSGGGNVVRDAVVMLSGKNNGGGVAWVGVLCGSAFNYDHAGDCPGLSPQTSNYGGDYAYVGTMDGDFDIWEPGVIWDVVATAHEIGHNFNSPHSHCFGNVLGNVNAVDGCENGECGGSGCYCGTEGIPGVGTLIGGSSGTGAGTIMSYCHLRSGGMGNISLNFGTGHTLGIAASRVATNMSNYVVATAPPAGCLDYTAGSHIFLDGFETGNTSRWGSDQP